ncbi:MAG: IS1 family transposase [Desulfobacteraceae bacterium]|nr:MAG: IS1 family transposase [Desulfobacteraceae bacterium]
MNKLSTEKRTLIVKLLVEGNSLRSTSRISGCSINTVTKLLVDLGAACAEYQDKTLRNIICKRVQCDEIWSFCYAKEKNVPEDLKGTFGYGDVYTWTAMCADTKLMINFLVGRRDADFAEQFINDLAGRLKNRVQVTTDGYKLYLEAIEGAFGCEVDYAMLIKHFGESASKDDQRKYSPSECSGTSKKTITGNPDNKYISTSYVERQNLTMRMSMRRFTRLTNGFSKKVDNLYFAVALHFMYYNFCRIHTTLRVTPAMEAGISDRLWSVQDILNLLD